VMEAAGHFPWLDEPDGYRSILTAFLATVS
jgi:hypothetical protein